MTFEAAIKLGIVAVFPALASLIFYILKEKTKFGKLNYIWIQIITGIVFGILSICGTEFGVLYTNGTISAILNVRDASPICAGLIFGPWSGVIAGFMGGAERALCVLWGGGTYSVVACSISTFVAGILAALARWNLFENRRPSPLFATLIAIVVEVVHMTIMLLTHLDDTLGAMIVIKFCTIPMIIANSLSVLIAFLAICFLFKKRKRGTGAAPFILETIESSLLVAIVITFLCTSTFVYLLQTDTAYKNVSSILTMNTLDIGDEIVESTEDNFKSKVNEIKDLLTKDSETDLKSLKEKYMLEEINIINKDGFVYKSSEDEYLNIDGTGTGYDMSSEEGPAEFLILLKKGSDEYMVQDFRENTVGGDSTKFAGIKYYSGFIEVGISETIYQDLLYNSVKDAARNRHIGETGQAFVILKSNLKVISGDTMFPVRYFTDAIRGYASDYNPDAITADPEDITLVDVDGKEYYFAFDDSEENYWIVTTLPYAEAMDERDSMIFVNGFMQIIVYAALFVLIFKIITHRVINKIHDVNDKLSVIIGGNLDVKVTAGGSQEMISLSNDINSTVDTLKKYIEATAKKIDDELKYAQKIQHSALPCVFPDSKDYTIYATMDTAKDVGGDFYDFYMLDETHLAFLIADVSGKGIPAAMFMMTAKTMIRGIAETGVSVEEIVRQANDRLCENNEAGMFVTAWMGILDLKSGELNFANAGHNPPVIGRADGSFEYLRTRPGLVLAGMEGVRYRVETTQLSKGDKIFLYTDGVTEATSADVELYGEDRLLAFLNEHNNFGPSEMIQGVRASIDEFVGEAEQFDDITMLMIRYDKNPE